MKVVRKIVFIILLIILGMLIANVSIYQQQPKELAVDKSFVTYSDLLFNYEITKYPSGAEISVTEPLQERLTVGVVVDPWNLKFGVIPAGNNFGTRFIDLSNLKEKEVKVSFKVYGNITPFVKFDENDFMLQPKENITVKVNFYTASAEVGNYSGEIDVIIQRPQYDFVYSFWR
jgi:hypothetical protein